MGGKGGITIGKYKKIERLLYNYKMLKINIENMEQEIDYIQNNCGTTGVNYDGVSTSPTFKINSATEDTALSNIEKIQQLQDMIKKATLEINSVDRALEGLEEVERTILIEKYINAKQWWQVSGVVYLGERQCRNIRKAAIEKMIIGIYGK